MGRASPLTVHGETSLQEVHREAFQVKVPEEASILIAHGEASLQ